MTTALDGAREKVATALRTVSSRPRVSAARSTTRGPVHDVVAPSETGAAPLGAIFANTSKFRVTCDNSSHPLTENIKR